MAEQNYGQATQGKVLCYVVARFSGHDNIRVRGDGKLAKVAEGAAQDGNGAACVIGFAPYTRVAAEGRGGTDGEVAQAAGVVESRECA